jgi:hypothetical protein
MRAVTQRADPQTAAHARVLMARLQLQSAHDVAGLSEIRATLLPALTDPEVPAMVHWLKSLDVLLEKAQSTGQPLALFAAAEVARDKLGAPVLAARLFNTYADLAPQAVWAPKALLAALELAPTDSASAALRARLERYQESAYLSGAYAKNDGKAYTDAEERLDRTLHDLMATVNAEADQRDLAVVHAVAMLDSVRTLARADSTRVRCGTMIDSLSVTGVRADSVRVACMRSDTVNLALYLKADTFALRGIVRTHADSIARTRAKSMKRDTTIF